MDIAENCFHLTASTEQTDGRSDGRADGARQPMNRQAPTAPHHMPTPTPPKFLTCCFTQPIMRAAAADPYPLIACVRLRVRATLAHEAEEPCCFPASSVKHSLLQSVLGLVVFAPPCNSYLMAVPPPSRRASPASRWRPRSCGAGPFCWIDERKQLEATGVSIEQTDRRRRTRTAD